MSNESRETWSPAIDIQETETELILKAEVPGVNPKEINVQVGSDTVLISGKHKEKECAPDDFVCQELHHGQFQRIVPLPLPVHSDKVEAELIDGILTLTMPKVIQ